VAEVLKPSSSFHIGWSDGESFFIEKIKKIPTFEVQSLKSHLPCVNDVVALFFFAVVP